LSTTSNEPSLTQQKQQQQQQHRRRNVSVYIEPHVEFKAKELAKYAPVDVVISPIQGQTLLPASLELVHGPRDSIRLMETLQPRYIVPMANADIDMSGLAAPLITSVGSATEFAEGLAKAVVAQGKEARGRREKRPSWQHPTIVSPVEPGTDIRLEL
jgi:hypothetical protein